MRYVVAFVVVSMVAVATLSREVAMQEQLDTVQTTIAPPGPAIQVTLPPSSAGDLLLVSVFAPGSRQNKGPIKPAGFPNSPFIRLDQTLHLARFLAVSTGQLPATWRFTSSVAIRSGWIAFAETFAGVTLGDWESNPVCQNTGDPVCDNVRLDDLELIYPVQLEHAGQPISVIYAAHDEASEVITPDDVDRLSEVNYADAIVVLGRTTGGVGMTTWDEAASTLLPFDHGIVFATTFE